MNAEYNREQNIEIRTLHSTKRGKCRICEVFINDDTPVVRLKVNGIETLAITLCFKCAKHINNLITNLEAIK